jgi:ppGpp synthetase/RelA/SpoT-type nucleotidyltranferase
MAYEWAKSNYSGKAVKKAGESLIKADAGALERVNALQVLSDWRASHAYPLHAILILLRKQSNIVDKGSIVVRRLKRTPSIVSKLTRYPNMKLHRMQDIGGCRSIVSSVKQVEKLLDNLQKSSTSHVIHKVKNYIDEPKDTGYRGVHVIYKYNASKQEFKDYFIEIQLRSKIQHAWATAVEIIDTYTKQALKSNQGDAEWRQFFVYASAEFAKLEGRKIGLHVEGIDTKKELKGFLEKLNVLSKLDAFSESSKFIFSSKKKEFDYFLLDMKHTLTSAVVTVRGYKAAELRQATDKYLELEKESTKDSLHDVVLVSAGSLKELKKAYPNYSADSKEFIKYIKQVLL